jgi:outer membrane protein with beta-barrel domain
MKSIVNKVITVLIVVLTVVSLNAQDFKYGVKAGANFSAQSELGDIFDNNEIRTGFNAGVYGNYSLNKRFSLQSELNYEQKGSDNDEAISKLDYLTIPVLANYSLGETRNSALNFSVYAGPYAGILLNSEMESDVEGITQDVDIDDQTENAEFGMVGGFIMKYPINEQSIFLDVRFALGLTSYDKNNSDLRNKTVGINLGFEF